MNEFKDFREEIYEIVVERERRRLDEMQYSKLKKEDPMIELNKLMSKINIQEINSQRSGNPLANLSNR